MNYKAAKISDADFAKWNIESDRKNIKSFARATAMRYARLLLLSARAAFGLERAQDYISGDQPSRCQTELDSDPPRPTYQIDHE
jgi:hypothetical protein